MQILRLLNFLAVLVSSSEKGPCTQVDELDRIAKDTIKGFEFVRDINI